MKTNQNEIKNQNVKIINGRKVVKSPVAPNHWDVIGVGAQAGKIIFTGSLASIKKALRA